MKKQALVTVVSLVPAMILAGAGMLMSGETGIEAIAPGLLVVADETGGNRVWVELGEDVLAIDAGSAVPPTGASPRYALATAAVRAGAPAKAAVLWPVSRALQDAPFDRVTINVESGFTLASGAREVVLHDLGRGVSRGDAVAWLPRERVLIAGALCSRDRVTASEVSDTLAWIDSLEELQDLEPLVVVPGHGPAGGAELLQAQVGRISELRRAVESGLLAGRSAAAVAAGFDAPWFEGWRKADPDGALAAVNAVFEEIGGLRTPWQLIEDRGLREGPSPTADDPGWSKPRKVLWRDSWPERLPMLAQVAPGVEIVPYSTAAEALAAIGDADALIGTADAELLEAGRSLRWVQVGSAGVERYLAIPRLASGEVLLTNGQRLASPVIAEHVMALTRALARGLNRAVTAQNEGAWRRSEIGGSAPLTALRGKTLLVVGLGGIGTEVARLADAAGMRVTAIRNSGRSGPPFVARVGLGEDLTAYLREADVVVNCLPMTPDTADFFDAETFTAMKPTAFFINVGRGGTVDTEALLVALSEGRIAGAGLDVTDPEPLPEGHPLWKAPNLVITPHFAAWSDADPELRWLLYRENLRRFVAGERLLSVVDPERGY
jgi:phosphoglycerate dehydrogenase-like enzyme/glyoxylase-like metal-dependent hydrolase (beta-lactamase superfamily II)